MGRPKNGYATWMQFERTFNPFLIARSQSAFSALARDFERHVRLPREGSKAGRQRVIDAIHHRPGDHDSSL